MLQNTHGLQTTTFNCVPYVRLLYVLTSRIHYNLIKKKIHSDKIVRTCICHFLYDRYEKSTIVLLQRQCLQYKITLLRQYIV